MSGGIHFWYSDAQVMNCQFVENTSDYAAGINCAFSKLSIDSSGFSSNIAKGATALQGFNSDINVDHTIFEKNVADSENGAAINYSLDSTIFGRPYQLSFQNSRFEQNSAAGFCGGVWIEQINSDISLIDIEINGCDFYKNHADRFAPLRIAGNISDIIVKNSKFINNTSTRWVAGPGIVMGASARITNTISSSNYANFSDTTKVSSNATVAFESQADFFNCTFFDSSDASGYGLSMRRDTDVTLTNCIIWGSGENPVSLTTTDSLGCNLYVNYCDIENGRDSIFVSDSLSTLHWGVGNIAADPFFTDAENGDFHLSDSSLCLGAGVNCIKLNDEWHCAPEFDMEGDVRPAPVGSNSDIGAYESNLAGPTKITHQMSSVPDQFKLYQNYPNPFNPVTTINWQLAVGSDVELVVYNILGEKVITLLKEYQKPGKYQIDWNAAGFPTGVYMYRIKTKYWQDVKKMILVR
jgi:hypothetical protein